MEKIETKNPENASEKQDFLKLSTLTLLILIILSLLYTG
ncbi:hypothetical protein C7460_104247 [Marinoscillum furvescens DSM 4134]|uniref:Uncharacterized protein n=1 Tax=Marinoscillum furvescens DSM 4134 TaxID=1122208 RepID=A0A3D9L8M2_MARFU|nr:hypothetical protein C7460_104247 [Marinoscillum furvescens DSM 4134]